MKKALLQLGAACAVLSIVVLVLVQRQIPHSTTLYAEAEKAEQILLQRGAQTTALRKENADWKVLASTGASKSFPADADQIKQLMSTLGSVQIEDEISSKKERWGEFDLTEQTALRIQLSDKKGVTADGFFGKAAPDYVHAYFRYPDKPSVYLARTINIPSLQAFADGWRKRDILSLADADVQNVVIQSGSSTLELKRSSDTWTVNGTPAVSMRVFQLVGALSHLRADGFPQEDRAFPAPLASITIRSAQGEHVIRIAPEEKAEHHHLVAANDSLFWVSSDKIKSLLPKLSDLQSH